MCPFWTALTGMIIVNFFYYWGTNQANNSKSARWLKDLVEQPQKGLLLAASLLNFGFPFIVVLPGIIAFYIFLNGEFVSMQMKPILWL